MGELARCVHLQGKWIWFNEKKGNDSLKMKGGNHERNKKYTCFVLFFYFFIVTCTAQSKMAYRSIKWNQSKHDEIYCNYHKVGNG